LQKGYLLLTGSHLYRLVAIRQEFFLARSPTTAAFGCVEVDGELPGGIRPAPQAKEPAMQTW
jgi:hypothetical protein